MPVKSAPLRRSPAPYLNPVLTTDADSNGFSYSLCCPTTFWLSGSSVGLSIQQTCEWGWEWPQKDVAQPRQPLPIDFSMVSIRF